MENMWEGTVFKMNNEQLMYLGGYAAGMITSIIIVLIAAVAVYCMAGPRKPYYRKPEEDEEATYACPRCGGTVGVYDMEDNYCSDCGQKIDWRKRK